MKIFNVMSGFLPSVKLDFDYIEFWMRYLLFGVQRLVINSICLFTVRRNPLPKLIEQTLY